MVSLTKIDRLVRMRFNYHEPLKLVSPCVVLLAMLVLAPTGRAVAAESLTSSPLWRSCESGFAAGQCERPAGVATDPSNGHVYIADDGNNRIDEFTPWGEFVKTFGWGVVASGPDNKPRNERVEVSVDATGGSFSLRYLFGYGPSGFYASVPIGFDASAAAVQSALEGITEIDPGDVTVSGVAGGPWVVEFTGGKADTYVHPLEAVSVNLTGGSATAKLKTVQAGANYEVCVPANGDVCREGQAGPHPGQLADPTGVAADSKGAIYVMDPVNDRIQKYGAGGEFLLMVGGGVDQGPNHPGNLCTVQYISEGDVCGPGTVGTGSGQFEEPAFGSSVAIGSGDTVYVGDKSRIQEFDSGGNYLTQISGGALTGERIDSLATDPSGDLYVTFESEFTQKENVLKLSSSGAELCTLKVGHPRAVASDGNSHVYVVDNIGPSVEKMSVVREFDSGCAEVGDPFGQGELEFSIGLAVGTACLSAGADIYVASEHGTFALTSDFVRAYGPVPDKLSTCPPPHAAPDIEDQHASSVGTEEATLVARINPRFWADTRYYLEYGGKDCATSVCEKTALAPGALLGAGASDELVDTPGVFLSGLEPGRTYYYRFVAESGGGGPVHGDGGAPGKDGLSGHFTTFAEPASAPAVACANTAFRTGASGRLPDCRAYEMVSPIDKGNSDIAVLLNFEGDEPSSFDESAADGDGMTYSSYRAFGDSVSAPYSSQYVARRGEAGWSNQAISPPREGNEFIGNASTFSNQYYAFTSNLCSGWLLQGSEPVLAPGAPSGFPNLYRHDDCHGGYDPVIDTEPREKSTRPELQGISADGTHTVFRIKEALPVDEGPGAAVYLGVQDYQVYEQTNGVLRVVSVLPNGIASTGENSAGSGGAIDNTRSESVYHAVSEDGSKVYWSSFGQIYLRLHADRDQSAIEHEQCVEEDLACTIPVSPPLSEFESASPDGTRALYTHAGDLYEFTYDPHTGETKTTLLAETVVGVLGTSSDASWVYFVASKELAAGAIEGEPNLYLREPGGQITFVATLAAADTILKPNTGILTPVSVEPASRSSRVSPDGRHAAFMSVGSLTGYDNHDAVTGKADAEVYVYDAGSKELHCVSCDRTGAQPLGRDIAEESTEFWVAGKISGWENQLYSSRAISDDGGRLFFESFDPLVLSDTNGQGDVYEWEAPGEDCSEQSSDFAQSAGGCVRLISSGESPTGSEFVDADPSGANVFFTTGSSLLAQDPGLVDIYDARVNGGFSAPIQSVSCEGEACQGAPSPPVDQTPASGLFAGPGNIAPAPAVSVKPKNKSASQLRAQALARTLRVCRREKREKKRAACEKRARKRYRAKSDAGRAGANRRAER